MIRVIFFAISHRRNNILDVPSLHKLQILKFAHLWQRNKLPDIFETIFNLLLKSIRMVRGMPPARIFINREQKLTLENSLYVTQQLISGLNYLVV